MAKPKITHEQVCPHCGEDFPEGGFVEIDGDYAFQEITCMKCGCRYYEVYKYVQTELWEEE